MGKSFRIITLGCKVNQCESAFIEETLRNMGYGKANYEREADVVIINTCIVTARASYQSRQAMRRARRENPEALIVAIGCYAQVFPEELSAISELDLIIGNKGKSGAPEIIQKTGRRSPPVIVREDFEASNPFEEIPLKRFSDRTRAFLKIQDGCESYCSYCIVPAARGPLRSLEPGKVIRLLKEFELRGYKEVVLTGIHLGKYGSDLWNGLSLNQMLREIDRHELDLRIRLSSLEPSEIEPALIELMATRDWLCRYVHISLQSGDDSVLERMNRHYTADMFGRIVRDIKDRIPEACIGVDVLVGFPGESDRAFKNTFELLRGLPVSYLHVFPYSKRKGTAAATFKDHVADYIIKERASSLRRLGRKKREDFWRSLLGGAFHVLSEGGIPGAENMMNGLSDNYVRFFFPSKSAAKNEMVKVKAEGLTEEGITARQLEDAHVISRISNS